MMTHLEMNALVAGARAREDAETAKAWEMLLREHEDRELSFVREKIPGTGILAPEVLRNAWIAFSESWHADFLEVNALTIERFRGWRSREKLEP